MTDYQALLEAVVATVAPHRGVIGLHNTETALWHYPACYNFDPDQDPHQDQKFLDLLAHSQPVLTDNINIQKYHPPGTLLFFEPRHVIAAPLRKQGQAYGLLWCDRPFKQGLFTQTDLDAICALIQQHLP